MTPEATPEATPAKTAASAGTPELPAIAPPRWPLRLLMVAVSVAALAGLSAFLEGVLIEYVQRIILLAGINAILAVSLNLINGTTGQFSIGHAGFMAIGAYGAAFFGVKLAPVVERLLGAGGFANAVTFNAALLIGAVLAGLTGL